jgi:hypothetical protein
MLNELELAEADRAVKRTMERETGQVNTVKPFEPCRFALFAGQAESRGRAQSPNAHVMRATDCSCPAAVTIHPLVQTFLVSTFREGWLVLAYRWRLSLSRGRTGERIGGCWSRAHGLGLHRPSAAYVIAHHATTSPAGCSRATPLQRMNTSPASVPPLTQPSLAANPSGATRIAVA